MATYTKKQVCKFFKLREDELNKESLKSSYRSLSKKYHPDKVIEEGLKNKAKETFQLIQEIYSRGIEILESKNLSNGGQVPNNYTSYKEFNDPHIVVKSMKWVTLNNKKHLEVEFSVYSILALRLIPNKYDRLRIYTTGHESGTAWYSFSCKFTPKELKSNKWKINIIGDYWNSQKYRYDLIFKEYKITPPKSKLRSFFDKGVSYITNLLEL